MTDNILNLPSYRVERVEESEYDYPIVLALATPKPSPTPPSRIVHAIAAGVDPRAACGAYHLERSVLEGNTQYVVCVRPTPTQSAQQKGSR